MSDFDSTKRAELCAWQACKTRLQSGYDSRG